MQIAAPATGRAVGGAAAGRTGQRAGARDATLAGGRDAYLARAAAQAMSTYAYLTLTGDWLSEQTSNRGADEHALALSAYLESVAPDTILGRVRCHA